jgi:hypothetical protein
VVMFGPIAPPLVGRNPIARRGQHEVLLTVLVSPEYTAFATEGAVTASHCRRPFRDGELRGPTVAASLYRHRLASLIRSILRGGRDRQSLAITAPAFFDRITSDRRLNYCSGVC